MRSCAAPSRASEFTKFWKQSSRCPRHWQCGSTAASPDFRFVVRSISRSHRAGSRDRWQAPHGAENPPLGERPAVRCGRAWLPVAKSHSVARTLRRARSAPYANIKTVADAKIGDTVTDANPAGGAAAGLRRNQADGVRGPLSGGIPRTRPAARRPEKFRLNDSAFSSSRRTP